MKIVKQNPQIQSNENEEHMKDPTINIILFLELHMTNKFVSNNYRSEGFGMQRFEDDLLGVLAESIDVLAQSLGVFA